jgi:hypothetical protein
MALAGGDYEIRIKGRLSDSLPPAFEGLMTTVRPGATVLHGAVRDQAALYRLLDRIQSLGLELGEIRQIPAYVESSQTARVLSGAGWWTDTGTDTTAGLPALGALWGPVTSVASPG